MPTPSLCFALTVPLAAWWETAKANPGYAIPLGFTAVVLLWLLVLWLLGLPSRRRAKHAEVLDPTQLEELILGAPPQIIDLRPQEVFDGPKGHIRNAVNIPFPQFAKRMEAFDLKDRTPIVLVDDHDILSHQAYRMLKAKGHGWVYVLQGGMKAWRRARLPVYSRGRERR